MKTPPIKPPLSLRMEAVPMSKSTAQKREQLQYQLQNLSLPVKRQQGGSSRGRLVYRPKKSKKVIAKKEEEEEPKATGEPGVADEAPLPETGANGGPNTDQSSELCCGPLEPMKLQRRRFQRLRSRSFLTLTIRMMTMMG